MTGRGGFGARGLGELPSGSSAVAFSQVLFRVTSWWSVGGGGAVAAASL